MAELSVQLTADIKQLQQALKRARKEISDTGELSETTALKIQKLGEKPAKSLNKLKGATANATPTLQEFSRVIQDAPFGIQGVGNNITQLTGNFGNLVKSAGGAGAALRLVVSSLAGPAGILFAVSTAVSLLTVFGDKLGGSANKAKKLKEELDGVNDKYGIYVGLAESEVGLLEAQGKSTIERKQALIGVIGAQIAELQVILDKNKAELTNLKLQNEQVDNWEVLSGLAATFGNQILNELTRRFGFLAKAAGLALGILETNLTGLIDGEIDRKDFISASAEERKKEQELALEIASQQTNINKLLAQTLELNKEITEERTKQAGRGPQQKVQAESRGIVVDLNNLGAGVAGQIETSDVLETIQTKLTEEEQKIIESLLVFNEQADNIIRNNIAQTFAGLGEVLGDALSGGGNILDKAGAVLLGSVGNLLKQLGQLAIQVGVGLLAIEKSLKTLNPFAAIAAGTALIALGSIFSKGARGIGSQIGGGGGGSGGFGGFAGAGSGSFIRTTGNPAGGGSFESGRVVFEIAGTKLLGVLERTQERNLRLGGT